MSRCGVGYLLGIVLSLISMNCFAQTNLLVNGGFEVPSQFSVYPGTEPAGFAWKVTSGDLEAFDSTTFGASFSAFEGNRITDTNGVSDATFVQTFATVPGLTYSLMFAYSNNPFAGSGSLAFEVSDEVIANPLLLDGQVQHGTSTVVNPDWTFFAPVAFTASSVSTRLKFRSFNSGLNGGVLLDAVTVFTGGVRTAGSVPTTVAGSDDHAFVLDGNKQSSPGGMGVTTTYRNLDLLGNSSYELLPLDMLCLDDGNGTLYIGPGATFIGNGVIKGSLLNEGLLIIPITGIAGSLPRVQPSMGGSGGTIIVPRPELTPIETPVVITPPPGGAEIQQFSGMFLGGNGGGFTTTGGGVPAAPIFVWEGDSPVIKGTIGWDGKLEVTGTFTQTSTGVARFYIAGQEQGVTYSQLDVGKAVTLDGTLQVVLRPELFGFLPQVGDYFDIITSDVGITLADADLRIDTLVMSAGAPLLNGAFAPLLAYGSGFAGDPDTLLDIVPDIFEYSIVDGGKTLRVTLVQPIGVPEPTMFSLVGIVAAASLAQSNRRKR
jgi:hypothetical protein